MNSTKNILDGIVTEATEMQTERIEEAATWVATLADAIERYAQQRVDGVKAVLDKADLDTVDDPNAIAERVQSFVNRIESDEAAAWERSERD